MEVAERCQIVVFQFSLLSTLSGDHNSYSGIWAEGKVEEE